MKNYYVSIIRRCELAYIRSELEEFGLSPLEGRLIRLLKDKFCSQEQLAEDLDIDKSRIAGRHCRADWPVVPASFDVPGG